MATSSWEDLRKRARAKENDINKKLKQFTELHKDINKALLNPDRAPLIANDEQFDSLDMYLQKEIQELQDIDSKMSEYATGASAVGFILRRHQDILRDFQQEYHRTRMNIKRQLDRAHLMDNGFTTSPYQNSLISTGDSVNRRHDMLTSENDAINSSHRMVDNQISVAIGTRDALHSQRTTYRDIHKRIDMLTKRYPAINSLMQKIKVKRQRDIIVIGMVITICLILIFLYLT